MSEKRVNQPVRIQAEKWFEALRAHVAAQEAQGDVAERLRAWATFEDLLGDCPRLLPPLMTMAWQLRHGPAFAELFQTASGAVAETTATPLTPHGKSFEQVVLGQLHGAMRVYCARLEKAWLATEKTRHRPSPITTAPVIGPLMRRLLRQRDEDIVRKYAQHGLYLALKPWLRHPGQFALIEALATLPTSTVGLLGDTTRGLSLDPAIRNLAALESRKCKFIVGLARVFAETVVADADAARTAGTATDAMATFTRANMAEIAGMALSQLTVDGLHLAKGAIAIQDHARDVVVKLSVPMGVNLWRAFADRDGAMNIVACPAVLVRAIGENASRVPRKTSEALASLPDQRIVEAVVMTLHTAGGTEALTTWTTSPQCVTVWLKMAAEIKQVLAQRGEGAVTPEAVASFCQSLVPTFTALCTESQPPPPPPVEAAAVAG
jgi:hypothetical protein